MQGVQSEAITALFLTCQPSLSPLKFCVVEINMSEVWQVDGRVGRGLLSTDCCFSWRQQSGPEHSFVRED